MSQDPTQPTRPTRTVPLSFVGSADQFIDGMPQGDVEVEQDRADELIATGLYAPKNIAPAKNMKGATAPDGDPQ